MGKLELPANWRKKSLSEVVSIVRSGVPEFQGQRKYVKTGNVQNGDIIDTDEVFFQNRPSRANMSVRAGDVLCARMKATAKVILIAPEKQDHLFSTGFAVLRPDTEMIQSKFLLYYLRSRSFQDEKDRLATGATQRAINNTALRTMGIPVPPLDAQGIIAQILEFTDSIRRKRHRSIQLTDNIMTSSFLRMFNGIQDGRGEWPTDTIGNVCREIYRYPTFYGIQYQEEGVPVVRIGNILGDGRLDEDLSHYVYIDPQISEQFPRTILDYGDVLMAVRGDGSTGKIGRVSTKELVGANISPNLIRIQADSDRIYPLFLYFLLASKQGQSLIGSRITRTAKKKITATEFKQIEIPVPPITLQEKFVRLVETLDLVNRRQKYSMTGINKLFHSLAYKAFNGDLAGSAVLSDQTLPLVE